jgi:hypothetical protein
VQVYYRDIRDSNNGAEFGSVVFQADGNENLQLLNETVRAVVRGASVSADPGNSVVKVSFVPHISRRTLDGIVAQVRIVFPNI